jgi:hypothetical protein
MALLTFFELLKCLDSPCSHHLYFLVLNFKFLRKILGAESHDFINHFLMINF